MHPFYPALYCLFVWWFSTGLIVFLNNLPPRSFRWSFGAFTAIACICFYRLAQGSHDTSIAGAYAAFTYGVLVWGWHEMAFFMGFLTGPRKIAADATGAGFRQFAQGTAACIDHELAILGTGIAVLWATWGAPNQVGTWTFMALWGMRQSAKLNVFLGVLNLGEAFLPSHLTYLISFMNRRRMNWLMPFSLGGGFLLVGHLIHLAAAPGITPFRAAGLTFLIAMLALAVLEHALLVLPLPFTALWSWWLLHAGKGRTDAAAALAGEAGAQRAGAGRVRVHRPPPQLLPEPIQPAPAWIKQALRA
jgi:putative photosynthetic complex assembly protein 2